MKEPWALALYRRSVIKQEKVRHVVAMLDPTSDKTCLDIGGDNGVVSLLLRKRGGTWHSADLDALTIASIRSLVDTNVHQIEPTSLPFADASLDVVVMVDVLEHIEPDHDFAREIARVLKPGGTLIVNVPHLKPGSPLNRLRNALGLTDEKHGHVRPGYNLATLRETLGSSFVLERSTTYQKTFAELLDIALNAIYERRKSRSASATVDAAGARSRKGTVVTAADVAKFEREFRLLGLVYPIFWVVVRLDTLLFAREGHRLIARYRRAV